ncbi:MAG: NUDIX domain-containing protein [Candidatus Binatia bacterium]
MNTRSAAFDAELRARVASHLARHDRREIALDGRLSAAVAVTILAGDDGEPAFLLTRRAARLARHAGQWALPGGHVEPRETVADAARRELFEEVGLALGGEAVLGFLDDYATRSGYVITPVVVWAAETERLVPDPREVASIHRVPLAVLEHPEVPRLRRIPESDRPVISIPMVGTDVHAPTAAIVFQLREVAVHGRATRVDHFEQPVFAWR